MFVNYAHRGASSYYPENTLSSFQAGLSMGANGIETDVHKTKDGVLVLFHDDKLDRVTDGQGPITDYTYEELLRLTVRNAETGRTDKILSLEDFLKAFSHLDLTFAIELKQAFIEQETIDMLSRYGMRDKTILTSFTFENLARAKAYAPDWKVGLLFSLARTPDPVSLIQSISGEQLCPYAPDLTQELADQYHALGYSVRAWGVKDEKIMKQVIACGADGMTVNFPDKLHALLHA